MVDHDFNYDKFVVVAEKEWKLDFESDAPGSGSRTTKFSVTIGNIEWQISSVDSGQVEKKVRLTCTTVADRCIDQVHAEIHGYSRAPGASNYVKVSVPEPMAEYLPPSRRRLYMVPVPVPRAPTPTVTRLPLRHIFKRNDDSLDFTLTIGSNYYNASLLFTVRVLKDRSALPNFKSPAMHFGRFGSNMKLRVANQTFHVSKQLLSMHSEVFDRMFHSQFKEANQEEVELKHEPVDPALFEDFLLVFFQHALPNRKNLSGLFKLANFYDANNVREKCERHFRMCREMPVEERYMLALELGNVQMKDFIMNSVDNADLKRIVAAFEERVEIKN